MVKNIFKFNKEAREGKIFLILNAIMQSNLRRWKGKVDLRTIPRMISKRIESFAFFSLQTRFVKRRCGQIWMDRFKRDTLYTPVVIKRLSLGTRRRQFIPETRRARAFQWINLMDFWGELKRAHDLIAISSSTRVWYPLNNRFIIPSIRGWGKYDFEGWRFVREGNKKRLLQF